MTPSTTWRAAASDLLLGSRCHGCERPAWTLCAACRTALDALRPVPTRPDPCPADFPTAWTGGPYDRLARRLVSAHKERSALGLTSVLGEVLALAVLGLLDETGALGVPVRLVPVPSARRAVRSRGFDAGLALARSAAGRLPASRAFPLLVPARRVADQSGLGAAERQANLAGAFRVRRAPPGRAGAAAARSEGWPVVVVDDVVTSGASLAEAVRALTTGGVEVVGAATFAATRRRRPSGATTAGASGPAQPRAGRGD